MPLETGTIIDRFTFTEAVGKLALDQTVEKAIKASRLFYAGDHWQNGEGWIGPSPADGNPQATDIMAKFQRIFVSKNLVAECVDRKRHAVIGRQPDWTITVRRQLKKVPAQIPDPTDPLKLIDDPAGAMVNEAPNDAEQSLIDEAKAFLVPWWDEQRILAALQEYALRRVNLGRGALRLFVPPDRLSDTGRVNVTGIDEALKLIYIETPEPEDAVIWTDRGSMRSMTILRIVENDDVTDNEKVTLELSALRDDGSTIIVTTRRPLRSDDLRALEVASSR